MDVLDETMLRLLGRIEIGEPVTCGPLHVFPLAGVGTDERDLTLMADALADGTLRVEEIGEDGSIPELRVTNWRSEPVLILEGDELVGAKQNRVVNTSVLLVAHSQLLLPVACVERGRWSRGAGAFSAGDGTPHLTLRRLTARSVHNSLRRTRRHASDQGAVWEEVGRKSYRHSATSPTDALQDAREHTRARLDAFQELSGSMPEGTRGVVVALGGRPVLAEILAGPVTFTRAFGRRLHGYAFEALEWEEDYRCPGVTVANEFLAAMVGSRAERYPAVGAGTDIRFASLAVSGYALADGEAVLHAAAFAR